jgi:hypothetical protein
VRETHSVLKNGQSFRERILCCPARGSVSFSPKKMAEHLKKADGYGRSPWIPTSPTFPLSSSALLEWFNRVVPPNHRKPCRAPRAGPVAALGVGPGRNVTVHLIA